jgi:hypothetical protein
VSFIREDHLVHGISYSLHGDAINISMTGGKFTLLRFQRLPVIFNVSIAHDALLLFQQPSTAKLSQYRLVDHTGLLVIPTEGPWYLDSPLELE